MTAGQRGDDALSNIRFAVWPEHVNLMVSADGIVGTNHEIHIEEVTNHNHVMRHLRVDTKTKYRSPAKHAKTTDPRYRRLEKHLGIYDDEAGDNGDKDTNKESND